MGADIIGWRGCSLQAELGPEAFLGNIKLSGYRDAIESQVPEGKRDEARITLLRYGPDGPEQREMSYRDIVAEEAEFSRGSPECGDCPLSGGAALGCYSYVVYPVDEVFERLVFDFFVDQLSTKDSVCSQLYDDIVSKVPSSGTQWHDRRSPDAEIGALARLPAPLVHRWGGLLSKKRVDSAQILQSLFVTLEAPAAVVAYGLFWVQLVDFGHARGVSADDSAAFASAEQLARMMVALLPGALEDGWALLVDA